MNNNIKNNKNKYLKKEELIKLEVMFNISCKYIRYVDKKQKEETIKRHKKKLREFVKLASKELNRSEKTIKREIKRGTVEQRDTLYYIYETYSYQEAWRKRKEKRINKRNKLKVNIEEIEYIVKGIKNKLSPYAILEKARRERKEIRICLKSIYNLINNRELEVYGITRDSLITKEYKKKIYKNKPMKRLLGNSIELRSEEINRRESIGHWEIDTVKGKVKGKSTSLLVLTERVSRLQIIKKIEKCSASNVEKALKRIMRDKRYIIKTITSDNGLEFSFGSRYDKVEWFYCHPYSSYERGSNEVQNKMIRRFIKKGERISKYSVRYIEEIEEYMNNYPRKIFNGKTSIEIYNEMVSNI